MVVRRRGMPAARPTITRSVMTPLTPGHGPLTSNKLAERLTLECSHARPGH